MCGLAFGTLDLGDSPGQALEAPSSFPNLESLKRPLARHAMLKDV